MGPFEASQRKSRVLAVCVWSIWRAHGWMLALCIPSPPLSRSKAFYSDDGPKQSSSSRWTLVMRISCFLLQRLARQKASWNARVYFWAFCLRADKDVWASTCSAPKSWPGGFDTEGERTHMDEMACCGKTDTQTGGFQLQNLSFSGFLTATVRWQVILKLKTLASDAGIDSVSQKTTRQTFMKLAVHKSRLPKEEPCRFFTFWYLICHQHLAMKSISNQEYEHTDRLLFGLGNCGACKRRNFPENVHDSFELKPFKLLDTKKKIVMKFTRMNTKGKLFSQTLSWCRAKILECVLFHPCHTGDMMHVQPELDPFISDRWTFVIPFHVGCRPATAFPCESLSIASRMAISVI